MKQTNKEKELKDRNLMAILDSWGNMEEEQRLSQLKFLIQEGKTQTLEKVKKKFILDACCGGRMMWFNKHQPNTIYIDNRIAEKGHIKEQVNHEVKPDFIMDFRNMTFEDKKFKLVVFDPPHLTNLTETSIMRKKFGVLNKETWQEDIKMAFKELWRVLDDYGILIIKWNDIQIPYKKMLSLFKESPLFMNITAGQKALKTKNRSYWFCFMKIPEKELLSSLEEKEVTE